MRKISTPSMSCLKNETSRTGQYRHAFNFTQSGALDHRFFFTKKRSALPLCLVSLIAGSLIGLEQLPLFAQAPAADPKPAQVPAADPKPAQAIEVPRILPPPIILNAAEEPKEDSSKSIQVFPQVPRELRRAMEDAQKLLDMERFAEAGRKLDQILTSEEDFFYLAEPGSDENGELYGNLQREADQLLESMPPEGQELYEMEFGTLARLQLEEALATGNLDLLGQTARRWFFTQAGSEAAFLLGLSLMDQRQPALALDYLQKLRKVPRLGKRFEPALTLYSAAACFSLKRNQEGTEILEEAERKNSDFWKNMQIAGQSAEEFLQKTTSQNASENSSEEPAETSKAAQLAQVLQNQLPLFETNLSPSLTQSWNLLQQNQARSTDVGKVSLPVPTSIWSTPMLDSPAGMALATLLEEQRNSHLPTHSPLTVGNSVLFRTAWQLAALDLQTGKKLWTVPSLDYSKILEKLSQIPTQDLGSAHGLPTETLGPLLMAGLIRHQVYGEKIYGELAANEKYVFCVEDTLQRFIPSQNSSSALNPQRQNPAVPENEMANSGTFPNRLVCYDIQTGKQIWHIGGNPKHYHLPESGTMFLGTPLCVGKILYVLGQRDGLIRLWALESDSGNVLWSQTLCFAPQTPLTSPIPCTPRLCGGMLICPTPNQVLIGVNAVSHKLCWANIYGTPQLPNSQSRFFDSRRGSLIQANFSPISGKELVTVGEKVLYLGMNDSLICLNAQDGKFLWAPKSTGQKAFIAFASEESVSILTSHAAFTYSMKDGKIIQTKGLSPSPEVSIAGRGFLADDSYILPFTNGQIIRFSAKTWEPLETVASTERTPLGNLYPAGDFLLSQGASSINAFIQQDAAEDFIKKTKEVIPDSPEARQVEALLLQKEGKTAEAIQLLKAGGPLTAELHKFLIFEILKPQEQTSENVLSVSQAQLEEWFAEMQKSSEKIRFAQLTAQKLMDEKRWQEALPWLQKFAGLMENVEQKNFPTTEKRSNTGAESTSNVTASSTPANEEPSESQIWIQVPFLTQNLENSEAQTPDSSAKKQDETVVKANRKFHVRIFGQTQLYQKPELWLGESLRKLYTELPQDSPHRQELEKWAEKEFQLLHQEFLALTNANSSAPQTQNPEHQTENSEIQAQNAAEKPEIASENLAKAQRLQKKYAKFRLRFAFWKQTETVSKEYFALLKVLRDFGALEALVRETESEPASIAAQMVQICFELQEFERTALWLRWLERNQPEKILWVQKTAAEWRRSLPEEHPIRTFLDPEFTEFPSGKILVKKETPDQNQKNAKEVSESNVRQRNAARQFQAAQNLRSFWNHSVARIGTGPEISPLEGTLIRYDASLNSLILCEDSLGRQLFSLNLNEFAEKPIENDFHRAWHSRGMEFQTSACVGTSFEICNSNSFQLFTPSIQLQDPENPELSSALCKKWQMESIPKESCLPASHQPILKQLKEKNLPIFRSSQTEAERNFVFANLALLQSRQGLDAFAMESGLPLWKLTNLNPTSNLIFQKGTEIHVQGTPIQLQWIQALPCLDANAKELAAEAAVEIEDVHEIPNSQALPPKASVPENFQPFETKRAISLEELKQIWQNEAGQRGWAHLPLPILDPRTGTCLQLANLPAQGRIHFPEWDKEHFLLILPDFGFGKFSLAERKFVWFTIWNREMIQKKIPYYLTDLKYTQFKKHFYFLNWKREIEVFDLDTGNCHTLKFQPVSEVTLRNNSGKEVVPAFENLCDFCILPDEDGCVTAAWTSPLDYREKLKNQKEQEEDEFGALVWEPNSEAALPAKNFQICHGLLCRFDAKGTPLWEKSHFVSLGTLKLDFPAKIPLLGLEHKISHKEENSRAAKTTLNLRFLDRRNGRMVLNSQVLNTEILSLVGDPTQKQAKLALLDSTRFVFTFTEEAYGKEEFLLNDARDALRSEIQRREKELNSKKLYQKGLEKKIEEEKRAFSLKKDPTEDMKQIFSKRIAQLELEVGAYRTHTEKEEKEIGELKKQLEAEIELHEGRQPETPSTPETPATPENPSTPETPTGTPNPAANQNSKPVEANP